MDVYKDNNLKRTIILEHYQNPKNKGLINDDSYTCVNMNISYKRRNYFNMIINI